MLTPACRCWGQYLALAKRMAIWRLASKVNGSCLIACLPLDKRSSSSCIGLLITLPISLVLKLLCPLWKEEEGDEFGG